MYSALSGPTDFDTALYKNITFYLYCLSSLCGIEPRYDNTSCFECVGGI